MYRTVLFKFQFPMKTFFLLIGCLLFGISYSQELKEADLIHFIATSDDLKITQIIQIGDSNKAEIHAQQLNLKQNGTNQEFLYINSNTNPSNLTVEMNGGNNYMEVLGSNQIVDNMQITVEGDYRTIIIRNYP